MNSAANRRSEALLPALLDPPRPIERLTCELRCSSGERSVGRWRGVPVRSLLAALGPPADATHLVFEGADGYRSVVPIADALRGIVALDRLDEVGRRLPRFVAPGLDGAKLVGPLRTVAAIVVAAGEDPVEVADADA